MSISIKGIRKAALLAALFNSSRRQGMGFLVSRGATSMTESDAEAIIDKQGMYFDYLRGRVMKVDISGDQLDTWAYDRDNGQGAAARAIESITQAT